MATADVFDELDRRATARLATPGSTPRPRARARAATIAALEGAFVLARALRSTEPLEAAGAAAADDVRAALAAAV